jgi:hypothetical protein
VSSNSPQPAPSQPAPSQPAPSQPAPSQPAPSQPTRTQSQIEADLGATRDRLAASVAALIDQVHPNRIKQRQIANVKQFANTELENAKSKIFNARGDLRTGRIVGVAAAVAGIVGFLLIIRAIVRRRSSDDSSD